MAIGRCRTLVVGLSPTPKGAVTAVTPACASPAINWGGEMGIQHPLQPGAALRLLTSSGEVSVTAEERDDLDVEPPDRRVEMKDGGRTAEVKSRSGSLRVRCPKGTDVSIGVISGGVRLAGEFGSVKVSAVSGHIEIDSASGDVDVRSVSGHLSVNTCG